MNILQKIVNSKIDFLEDEYILQYKINTIIKLSLFGAIGVLIFSVIRFMQGNIIVAVTQFAFGALMLYGFFRLKKDKDFYQIYSIMIFILFFIYIHVIFFYVPQNSLNILWIISAPVLIFFFLDKDVGTLFLVLLMGFVFYLIYVKYPYTVTEYITLTFVLLTTSLVMYTYEKIKNLEKKRLLEYNQRLQNEVNYQTKELKRLNEILENRVEEEVSKRVRQEEMLLRQNRMANMGQMIDAIAHQWRQPLMNINSIMMNIDLALEKNETKKHIQKKVLEVFETTSHMSKTIEDFRHLLGVKQIAKEFLLRELFNKILNFLKRKLKGVKIELDCPDKILLKVCSSELSQVFIIIFSNMAEAFIEHKISNPKIKIKARELENFIKIEICDNAGGVDKSYIDKIFDPYFTTKRQTGGTGLGLYIAKIIIVHNMGGIIEAKNQNSGVCFSITIPKDKKWID